MCLGVESGVVNRCLCHRSWAGPRLCAGDISGLLSLGSESLFPLDALWLATSWGLEGSSGTYHGADHFCKSSTSLGPLLDYTTFCITGSLIPHCSTRQITLVTLVLGSDEIPPTSLDLFRNSRRCWLAWRWMGRMVRNLSPGRLTWLPTDNVSDSLLIFFLQCSFFLSAVCFLYNPVYPVSTEPCTHNNYLHVSYVPPIILAISCLLFTWLFALVFCTHTA